MKLQETCRKDGLRIITISLPNQRKVYVELSCRVGSAYDPEDKRGLFHFFEHMAFKGTKRRKLDEIQSFIQRNLLVVNAVTRSLITSYYGITVYTKMKETCDLLCDIYCNSTFPKDELEKERGPILLEIARNKDEDDFIAFETIRNNLWNTSPMRMSGGGTTEGVKAVQRTDILRERNKWHVPAATVVIAIGKIDHNTFVREINKHIPINHRQVTWKTWDDEHEILPAKQRVVIKKPKRNKVIMMLVFKIPYDIPDRIKDCLIDCIEWMLSSGPGSRMYKEIRDKRGLAYAVGGGFNIELGLSKYFCAYVETSLEHVAETEQLLLKAMTEPFTNKRDFEEARERSIDRATIGFDDNFDTYSELIWEKITEKRPPKELLRYFSNSCRVLESISLEEIEAVRKEFFRPEKFIRVIVEPQ